MSNENNYGHNFLFTFSIITDVKISEKILILVQWFLFTYFRKPKPLNTQRTGKYFLSYKHAENFQSVTRETIDNNFKDHFLVKCFILLIENDLVTTSYFSDTILYSTGQPNDLSWYRFS